MEKLNYTAEEIKLKVIRLLANAEVLKKQLSALEQENVGLRNEIEKQKNTIRGLEETNKIVKIAEALVSSGGDLQPLKKMLNDYIREIDECIRLLSDR